MESQLRAVFVSVMLNNGSLIGSVRRHALDGTVRIVNVSSARPAALPFISTLVTSQYDHATVLF